MSAAQEGTTSQQQLAVQEEMPPAQAASAEEEEAKPAPPSFCGLTYLTILKMVLVILIITGIVLGLTIGDLDSRLRDLFEWLENNRLEGILIYLALYAGLTGALVTHARRNVCQD